VATNGGSTFYGGNNDPKALGLDSERAESQPATQ
jgi:hypothetical protein